MDQELAIELIKQIKRLADNLEQMNREGVVFIGAGGEINEN